MIRRTQIVYKRRIHVMDEANQSRTVVSVPRPPTTKLFESILLFGGAGGRGTETTVLLRFARLFTPLSPLRRGGVGGGAVFA